MLSASGSVAVAVAWVPAPGAAVDVPCLMWGDVFPATGAADFSGRDVWRPEVACFGVFGSVLGGVSLGLLVFPLMFGAAGFGGEDGAARFDTRALHGTPPPFKPRRAP